MSPTDSQTKLRNFDNEKFAIRDADLLLFRRHNVISIAGRGIHSHAAMAGWWDDELYCLEFRELRGGRGTPLRGQVAKYPGRIDVYFANPENRWPKFDREDALRYMRSSVEQGYGYAGVAQAALLHLPFVRLFTSPELDDTATSTRPPFCSDGVARAYRSGGKVDVVNHLADQNTEPADLARSLFFEYGFTLR